MDDIKKDFEKKYLNKNIENYAYLYEELNVDISNDGFKENIFFMTKSLANVDDCYVNKLRGISKIEYEYYINKYFNIINKIDDDCILKIEYKSAAKGYERKT